MVRLCELGLTPEQIEQAESFARRLGEQFGVLYTGDQLASLFERMLVEIREDL